MTLTLRCLSLCFPVRLVTALMGVLALIGCAMVDGIVGTTRVSVLNDTMIVAAPSGYCIDTQATHQAADTAIVLIGRCAATGTVAAAVVTVSVGPSGSAGVMLAGGEALAGYFSSKEGRKVLSRDGRADHVALLQTAEVADSFLMEVSDRMAGDYWRAITGLRGRLITVSATGTEGLPLPPEQGRKLVEATLRLLRQANPRGPS